MFGLIAKNLDPIAKSFSVLGVMNTGGREKAVDKNGSEKEVEKKDRCRRRRRSKE